MRKRIAILLPVVVFMGGCARLNLTDADTVVPALGIQDGKQTFDVYRCARR